MEMLQLLQYRGPLQPDLHPSKALDNQDGFSKLAVFWIFGLAFWSNMDPCNYIWEASLFL